MKTTELKELVIKSLNAEGDNSEIVSKLAEAGVTYDFSNGFADRVSQAIFSAKENVTREIEFVRGMNYIFYRIAFTGIAAILVLLLTIFLSEGSLSINAFLGLGNGYDESIFYVLAGN